ncbi:MAG TPA: hypothetical protein VHK64_01810, partial [Nocardioidaceae bacterium]|nr:hypothetical protein [Nocardioidaceae bacterium]
MASAARSSAQISPTFELTVGVGEKGIPLSPDSIILPRSTDRLPPGLVRNALNLVGLGFSLATAPPALTSNLPRLTRPTVDERIYQLAQAGRHVNLGENLFDSAALLAAEWQGARDSDWEWDLLRRTTDKGGRVGASLGEIFSAEAVASSPHDAFARFAKTTGFLPEIQGVLATGSVRLTVSSRTGGQQLSGGGLDAARKRDLPFADLYVMGGVKPAQMAFLAVPEDGGYRARIAADGAATTDVELLVPDVHGALRLLRWTNVSLSAGGSASVDFRAADSTFTLLVDQDGDGTVDSQLPDTGTSLARRPFGVVAAVQNKEVDPTGHVIDILFTADVDLTSLLPKNPDRFKIPGKISNGGLIPVEQDVASLVAGLIAENPFEGLRNTRIVRVVFNNPLSPYVTQSLTVGSVKSTVGDTAAGSTVTVRMADDPMEGTMVAGQVFGPDGNPVPFAEVELHESDYCMLCLNECQEHKTAVVQADVTGHYLFDYVRQTTCSDIF